MADVTKLKGYADAYGIAVRAGVLTPSLDDEVYFRNLFGLPEMNDAVRADWAKTDGARQPITLAKEEETVKKAEELTEPTK
jgi:hypothetical protein